MKVKIIILKHIKFTKKIKREMKIIEPPLFVHLF